MRALLSALITAALTHLAAAQTTIPAGPLTTQTWTLAGSPYIVNGDVTLASGNTLTIEPGVQVLFPSAVGGRITLNSGGTLTAQGTAAQPILFAAQTGTLRNEWTGILLNQSNATANLSNVVVRNAATGVNFAQPSAILQISRATFERCATGLSIAGSPTIADVTVSDGSTGINVSVGTPWITRVVVFGCGTGVAYGGNAGATVLDNSHFYSNGLGASLGQPSGQTAQVLQCTFNNNTTGIRSAAAGAVVIGNCTVASNGIGIQRLTGGMSVVYSNVWGNTTSDYSGTAAGAGTISANPLLAAVNDPHIPQNSPCVDGGNVSYQRGPDLYGTPRPQDGNRNGTSEPDMGCVEYSCGTMPAFASNPASATVAQGAPFTLSVTATGTGPLTYQWRMNGVNLTDTRGVTGSTTSALTIPYATPGDAGVYDAIVANACGSVTSSGATVTVSPGCGSSDFNGDGDFGTDADIEAFFRVLAGGSC